MFSIDGAFYPFQWFDSCVGIIIYGLLALLLKLSLLEDPSEEEDGRGL